MTVPTPGREPVAPYRSVFDQAQDRLDEMGRRIELSRRDPIAAAECCHCTVPVDDGDVCGFCQSYTPPETAAQRIDVVVNRVDLLRADINAVLTGLPADAPLMAVVDVVTALGHLRRAAVLLDKANDALEIAAAEVK